MVQPLGDTPQISHLSWSLAVSLFNVAKTISVVFSFPLIMNSFPSLATDGGVGSASAAHSNSDAIYFSDPQVLAAVQEAKARAILVNTGKSVLDISFHEQG